MRIEGISVYQPQQGFLFSVNPFLKITFMFVASVFCFAASLRGNALFFFFVLALLIFSRINIAAIFRSFQAIYFFLLIGFAGNLFLHPGREIFRVFNIPATYEGLIVGLTVFFRLTNILLSSLAVSLTTSQTEISEAIEKLLSPLRLFGINTAEIAFVLSLTIRALVILAGEVLELKKLYQAKGIIKKKMNLKEQIMAGYYILVPMIVLAMRRSEEMSFALTVRGYNPDRKRIVLEERRLSVTDGVFVLAVLAAFSASLFLEVIKA